MDKDNVLVFPDAVSRGAVGGIDPNLLLALNNNGGFGGNGNWIWILFLWLIWGNNGWGNNGFGGNNGTGYLANQMSNEAGRDLLLQAINGRAAALGQLAQITNSSVDKISSVVAQINTAVQTTGLQTINALQLGDAAISRQICECCCENRLAICQQTNALQATLAANHAEDILRSSQAHAEDRLDVCQQTNDLKTQSLLNTQGIKDAIAAQSAMINDKFCDLEKRELQNKINMQGDIITQLRNQISNDHQTLQFNAAFHALDDKVDAIAAKQPNTVPVQWPNLVAANATPYLGQSYYPGFYGNYGGWGAGVNGGVIL